MKSLFLPCCLIMFLVQAQLISALIHSSQAENEPFNLSLPMIHQAEKKGLRNVGKEIERGLQKKLEFDSRAAHPGRGGGSTLAHQPRSSKSSAASLAKKQFLVSSAAEWLIFSAALAFLLIL